MIYFWKTSFCEVVLLWTRFSIVEMGFIGVSDLPVIIWVEVVTDSIFLGSKITVDGDWGHEIKRCLLLGRKAVTNWDKHFIYFFNFLLLLFLLYNIVFVLPYINMHLPRVYTCSPSWNPLPLPSPDKHFKKHRHHLVDKGPCCQSYGFSSSHVMMWELNHKESFMFSDCGALEDSWEFFGQQEEQTSQSYRKSILNIHWKDCCWSWSFNTLATWCEELIHWERPWCWERLKAKGEGGGRAWNV